MITIRTAEDVQTTDTGVVLPRGTRGRILAYEPNHGKPFFLVDFGLATVVKIEANSRLVQLEK